MIIGLQPHVFFAFLSWPFVYIIICIIMFCVYKKHEGPEKEWEKAYDEYVAKGGTKGQWKDQN